MSQAETEKIVRTYHDAYRRGDVPAAGAQLAESFKFSSPIMAFDVGRVWMWTAPTRRKSGGASTWWLAAHAGAPTVGKSATLRTGSSDTLARMKTKTGTALTQLRRLINGYQVTQALHVLVVLGVPDELAAGPRTVDDLAAVVGANETVLYRVLRAVAAIGVLEELPGRRFRLTDLGNGLRADAAESLAGWAAFVGRPYHQAAWARLVDGVRTGEVPFRIEFGTDIWTYRREHAEETPIFNRAMNSLTGSVTESIVAGYDFSRFGLVVDVGGGGGALLVAILNRYPSVSGVLFDLPHVVADSRTFIDESGFGDRIQLVGGSFLEEVPPGGDAYLFKSVLHNWDDNGARRILKTCRDAMTAQAKLLVLERLIPEPNQGVDEKFMDVNMFVGPGSFERTAEEWERLFDIGGFKLHRITPVGVFVVIEATPA